MSPVGGDGVELVEVETKSQQGAAKGPTQTSKETPNQSVDAFLQSSVTVQFILAGDLEALAKCDEVPVAILGVKLGTQLSDAVRQAVEIAGKRLGLNTRVLSSAVPGCCTNGEFVELSQEEWKRCLFAAAASPEQQPRVYLKFEGLWSKAQSIATTALDYLPFEAKSTIAIVNLCRNRAFFLAGFAFNEVSRFGGFGGGTGASIWYMRFRLLTVIVSITCVCFASSISTQFGYFKRRRSKRLFALAVRFWSFGCFRLFLAAYTCEALALIFIGDTYFPTTCGSFQATQRALHAANLTSIDDPQSPCEAFFGAELTRAIGIALVFSILVCVVATSLRLRRFAKRCICCLRWCQRRRDMRGLGRPQRLGTALLKHSTQLLSSAAVITTCECLSEQCIFVASFANNAMTRTLPHGVNASDTTRLVSAGTFVTCSALAGLCATLAVVMLSIVQVNVEAATAGLERERVAGTATVMVRTGVVLYVVALILFLCGLSLVGFGADYEDTFSRFVPTATIGFATVVLVGCLSAMGVAVHKTSSGSAGQHGGTKLAKFGASGETGFGAEDQLQTESIEAGADEFNPTPFAQLVGRMGVISSTASLAVFYNMSGVMLYRVLVTDSVTSATCTENGGCGQADPDTPVDTCNVNSTDTHLCNAASTPFQRPFLFLSWLTVGFGVTTVLLSRLSTTLVVILFPDDQDRQAAYVSHLRNLPQFVTVLFCATLVLFSSIFALSGFAKMYPFHYETAVTAVVVVVATFVVLILLEGGFRAVQVSAKRKSTKASNSERLHGTTDPVGDVAARTKLPEFSASHTSIAEGPRTELSQSSPSALVCGTVCRGLGVSKKPAAAFDPVPHVVLAEARKAANEVVVRRVLAAVAAVPDRALFVGVFAYTSVMFFSTPARGASYAFLSLCSACWMLALSSVAIAAFVATWITSLSQLEAKATFARFVIPYVVTTQNMVFAVMYLFVFAAAFIGFVKAGSNVSDFTSSFAWANVALSVAAAVWMVSSHVVFARLSQRVLANTKLSRKRFVTRQGPGKGRRGKGSDRTVRHLTGVEQAGLSDPTCLDARAHARQTVSGEKSRTARQRWRFAARNIRIHPLFTMQLREAQRGRIDATLLRYEIYARRCSFISGVLFFEMFFTSMRSDLNVEQSLVGAYTRFSDASNWAYYILINLALTFGIAVVYTSVALLTELRRLADPLAQSRFHNLTRRWDVVVSVLASLQLYAWLIAIIRLTCHSIVACCGAVLLANRLEGGFDTTLIWLHSVAAGLTGCIACAAGQHEIFAIKRSVRIAADFDKASTELPWFQLIE